jgi:oligopeptide transport system ATP-binding protein
VLTVENLSVWLPSKGGALQIVDGVDLEVGPGEFIGIAGESGCGKTITSLALLGLLPAGAATRGRALFEGRDLLALSQKELRSVRGAEIGMVFQDPMSSLHPLLTVERQLTDHVEAHLGVTRRQARERALDLLELVRIPDPRGTLRVYPHQLSGGMRQRVAIAIAIACHPKLLIADEPTTALDVTVQAGILALLDTLRREQGVSILFITHDLGVMSAIAERLYVFYAGQVVEAGSASELLTAPFHPYTQALVSALPDPANPRRKLLPILGRPPSPGAIPEGCPFHPRCSLVQESCRHDPPPPLVPAEQRLLRCPVVLAAGRASAPVAGEGRV